MKRLETREIDVFVKVQTIHTGLRNFYQKSEFKRHFLDEIEG